MTANPIGIRAIPASHVLGRKLDSIPFSPYHIAVILVLGLVGFTDGYDLALTGSLLVLAKGPLHITPDQIRWLTARRDDVRRRRRLYLRGDLRPCQPQDDHPDRRRRHDVLHPR